MQTSGKSLFASVIEDHLALKRKNAALEMSMPLDRFIPADPFDNHSLFKSEYDARLEEEETGEHPGDHARVERDIAGGRAGGCLARSPAVRGVQLGRLAPVRP